MYCPSANKAQSASKTPGKSTSTKPKQSCTFGVELELVALVPDKSDSTAHHTVYEVLRKPVSLPCPYKCQRGRHELRLPVDNRPPSFWDYNQDDNEYNTWVVGRDCSVRLTDDEKPYYPNESVYSDVELQCRILDFFNPTPCPHNQVWPCNGEPLTWTWRDEITTIVNTLKQGFNRPGYRVFANGTCGLHLHVGRLDFGFNLATTQNVMELPATKTIEFRLHTGTLDVVEICAWVDLLCRLTVYCENTSTTAVTAYLETRWTDPDITLVDIAKLVGAAETTITHYSSVLLTLSYATTFFDTSTTSQAIDILTPLTLQVEQTRLAQSSRSAISTRITQKLISGRYGQFPISFLKKMLPAEVLEGSDGRYLSKEMSKEQMEEWASEIEERTRLALDERRRWDGRRGASTSLNNLLD